jgi:DNA invertase Pin-like site-specific DNA recombinase
MKAAIYARYSSDNQCDASIADQLRICREYASRQDWTVVQEFRDHAISGATLLRSGFQALMRDALNRRFDVVLAESLDRFSRDQEDTRRALQAPDLRRRKYRHACRGRHHAPAHRVQGNDERAVPEGPRGQDASGPARARRGR